MTEFGTTVDLQVSGHRGLKKYPWVRLPLTLEPERAEFLNELQNQGHKTLGVLTRDSFPWGWDKQSVHDATSFYLQNYHLTALEVGNEPDLVSDSSWTMLPEEWEQLIHDVWDVTWLEGPPLIGGGLAAGDPAYLVGLDLMPLSGIGFHPYGRLPNDLWAGPNWGIGSLKELVQMYAPFNLPLWATEYGCNHHETGKVWQGRYVYEMAGALKAAGVETAIQFCFSDAMVDGFGLYDAEGKPKSAARKYKSLIAYN